MVVAIVAAAMLALVLVSVAYQPPTQVDEILGELK